MCGCKFGKEEITLICAYIKPFVQISGGCYFMSSHDVIPCAISSQIWVICINTNTFLTISFSNSCYPENCSLIFIKRKLIIDNPTKLAISCWNYSKLPNLNLVNPCICRWICIGKVQVTKTYVNVVGILRIHWNHLKSWRSWLSKTKTNDVQEYSICGIVSPFKNCVSLKKSLYWWVSAVPRKFILLFTFRKKLNISSDIIFSSINI